jgi:hypothetical protein
MIGSPCLGGCTYCDPIAAFFDEGCAWQAQQRRVHAAHGRFPGGAESWTAGMRAADEALEQQRAAQARQHSEAVSEGAADLVGSGGSLCPMAPPRCVLGRGVRSDARPRSATVETLAREAAALADAQARRREQERLWQRREAPRVRQQLAVVPPPRHQYPGRNPGLTEISYYVFENWHA